MVHPHQYGGIPNDTVASGPRSNPTRHPVTGCVEARFSEYVDLDDETRANLRRVDSHVTDTRQGVLTVT
jgi:hypothetical protein